MTLLDRVKERVSTDLTDPELQRIIDAANQEIIDRYGPHPDSTQPITVTQRGLVRMLDVTRPIDTGQTIVITEFVGSGWTVEESTVMASNDYRVWYRGRTLERLATGTTPRVRWGHRVVLTYTPQNDGDQRQEVIIQLTSLAISQRGGGAGSIRSLQVGDVKTEWADSAYQKQREALLSSLAPRKGLLMA
jgi:hypothetical protein